MKVELIVCTPSRPWSPGEEIAITYLPEDWPILPLEASYFYTDWLATSVTLEIDGVRTPLPWKPPNQ